MAVRGIPLSEQITGFSPRFIAFSSTERLPVEMAVLAAKEGTWVILREGTRRPGQGLLLSTYFEYIAANLRTELLYLKRLPEPLKFFHCTYEAGQGKIPVRWVFKEVHLCFENGTYALARWDRAPRALQESLSEALNLLTPPKRTCL